MIDCPAPTPVPESIMPPTLLSAWRAIICNRFFLHQVSSLVEDAFDIWSFPSGTDDKDLAFPLRRALLGGGKQSTPSFSSCEMK
ncbi:hypothetical protein TNCT_80581 [Trichonephila clavata]|uniref:Uncharacterized protein n=1 Tax=Trichonephila clavata TaxID=2740835 RepID=A0A8X6HP91_TRICU|nr:hypothetical protein TNCT_80581 [Trichonephila clavata]